MAHLVAHDEENFVVAIAIEQCVPEHDPLGAPEPGHIRVHSLRIFALGNFEDAARLDARASASARIFCSRRTSCIGPNRLNSGS